MLGAAGAKRNSRNILKLTDYEEKKHFATMDELAGGQRKKVGKNEGNSLLN